VRAATAAGTTVDDWGTHPGPRQSGASGPFEPPDTAARALRSVSLYARNPEYVVYMNRREFLRTGAGATAVAATAAASTAGTAAAQSTKEVVVGPDGNLVFEPVEVYVQPGGTVKWTWDSNNHNIQVLSQPDGANWEGTEGSKTVTYNTGHEYEYTFETKGEYEYQCFPHAPSMAGKVIVNDSGEAPSSGGGGATPKDPKHMGVPIQAHFVGIATILAIIVSLLFTFFLLKYGESPHASGGD
jgi:plastocyanin